MIPTAQSQPPRRRWRWQFSLFTLLMVVIFTCVIAAYLGTARRLEEANATVARQQAELKARDEQIARLEAELGKLSIKDPTKVHILTLPSKEDWHFRWRIYLPKGFARPPAHPSGRSSWRQSAGHKAAASAGRARWECARRW